MREADRMILAASQAEDAARRLERAADEASRAASLMADVLQRLTPLIGSGYGNNVERFIEAATAEDVGSPARYAQFVGRCDRSSVLAEKLCLRLASAWLHGNWKAETPAEAEMQEIMVKLGWWPITQQALLERAAAIDVAPSANG